MIKVEKTDRTYTKRIKGQPYVLGIGCSYTNPELVPRLSLQHPSDNYDFPKWTELLAAELRLGWEVWAENGVSNQKIFETAVKYLATDDNIELIVIQWSDWLRFSIWSKNQNLVNCIERFKTIENANEIDVHKFVLKDMHKDSSINIDRMIDRNLHYVYTLQELCKKMNKKFLMFSALQSHFGFHTYQEMCEIFGYQPIQKKLFYDKFINHPYALEIDTKTYIDFPKFDKDLNSRVATFLENNEMFVNDSHANEKGHKKFASVILERYEDFYEHGRN